MNSRKIRWYSRIASFRAFQAFSMLRPPSLKDFRPDRHRSTNRNANRLERANGDPDNIC